jgi:hypothetical protein
MNDFELLNLLLFATQGVVHKLRLQAEVQLNKDETDPYFIQLFQGNTTVCLIIHVFCKSCEPEIVFVLIFTIPVQFHVTKLVNQHCCALEISKKISTCLIFIQL